MKHLFPLLAGCCLASQLTYAQAPGTPAKPAAPAASLLAPTARGTARVSGTVVDATTKQPVEFATIALLPAIGEKPLDGTVCDEKGRFMLKGLAGGEFRILVSFIGYGPYTQALTVTDGKSYDLGTLTLQSERKQLQEVTITGERPIVESKPDRLVYNAAEDNTNKGATAADVLRKAPMLSVDPDGNLQLRGSGNVSVLINGKPSSVVSADVAQALKQLPGDQIKSVEVITNPSAKYDSEGSAGIINIVLKENNLQGINGNVGLAVGTRNSNGSLGLNARKGKLGFSSSVNGWAYYSPNEQLLNRTDFNVLNNDGAPTSGYLSQRNTGNGGGGGGQGRLGLDYEPAPNHALNLSLSTALFRNRFMVDLLNQYQMAEGTPPGNSRDFRRDLLQQFRMQNYDLTGSYTRTFEKGSRREWSVLGQHSRNRRRTFYDIDQYAFADVNHTTPEYQENSPNLALNRETTLQTDYVHPLSDKQTIETGGKLIWRNVGSDYQVNKAYGTDAFVEDAALSNVFAYSQNVAAGYATYATSLGKLYSVRLGARVERTDLSGEFQGQEARFTTDYTNLLPNLSLTRNLKQQGSTLRLSYSKRIQRPSIFYLNPYRNQTDQYNVQYGNPQLNAEFTDNYELNWNAFVKGSVINISPYARITNNAIEAQRTTVQAVNAQGEAINVVETTYGNIARNQSYGVNLFGSIKPLPKWDISGNVNVYYVYLSSAALNTTNRGVVYATNINSGYKFDKGLSLQFFGMLNSPRIQLQGKTSSWQMYSIGLRKQILKEKGDLTLNADNPFTRYIRLDNQFRTQYSEQNYTTKVFNRGVRLAFNYRFGKLENKPKRPARSIRNDDQKQGESGNGGNQ